MEYSGKAITRNEYLEKLPKDKDGNPIIKNMEEFEVLSYENGWDYEFAEYLIDNGEVSPFDYEEFFQIQD